ncbi:hypothetical protein GCM10023190_07220 [Enteractinococcus fodinae]|uniref:DUF2550 family protein n=1 Tax=Enteractinococcus fodinae TaxID=684663 RepID=A0ABU2AZM0_9MICC|nr:DUF2550 family protein [Enteractinococcus fodinae]MDR7346800.1 hypothetical protein [Enteractinococcus fodinae]
MPSWLAWTLLAAALLAFVVVVIFAWRLFTLLRTPGSFNARLVSDHETNQPGRPVVVSYNEYSVEIFSVYSIWPRPRLTVPRHYLEVTRAPRRTRMRAWLQLENVETGRHITIAAAQEHASELTTWYESGPAVGIGHWREAPRRRQRRRYF